MLRTMLSSRLSLSRFPTGISTCSFLINGGPIASPTPISVPNFGANPTNLQMSIYVPTKLATEPAIILAVS